MVDTRTGTYYYGCGGHITKGNSICQMNPLPQDVLELTVIETVLDFYRQYTDKDGHRKLAEAVKGQIGSRIGGFRSRPSES